MSEICRAFRNTGKCRNGDDCKFEHSEGEKIAQPPRGECFNFQQQGECEFGDRCRFTHGPADERYNDDGSRKKAPRPERPPQEKKERAPKAEGEGVEKKKKRVNKKREDRAPREKLDEVCNKYMEGQCRYGENCRRQHPGDVPQVNLPKAE